MQRYFRSAVYALVMVALLVAPVLAAPPVAEDLTVAVFGTDNVIEGATATLTRHSDKVRIKITTNSLDAGAVYTVWAVAWNDPENECDGGSPCGMGDMGTAAVFLADGKVISSDGTAVFNAMLREDSTPLTNAMGAEIHFVIRTHGQPIPGRVEEQKSEFNGGCPPNFCDNQQGVFPGS